MSAPEPEAREAIRRAEWGRFVGVPHERLCERAAAAAAIVGPREKPDYLSAEWGAMQLRERQFWLNVSKLPRALAVKEWTQLHGNEQCVIRSNLYRAAARAAQIVGAGEAVAA